MCTSMFKSGHVFGGQRSILAHSSIAPYLSFGAVSPTGLELAYQA